MIMRFHFIIPGIIALAISFYSCSPEPYLVCDPETEMAYNKEREELGIPLIDDNWQISSAAGDRQCSWENTDENTGGSFRESKTIFFNAKGEKTAESDYYILEDPQGDLYKMEVTFILVDERKSVFPWRFRLSNESFQEIKSKNAKKRLSEAGFEELIPAIERYDSYKIRELYYFRDWGHDTE